MNNDYSYSYEWDQRYCYPHSNVLINKLGIEDAEKLHIAEREITSLRIANAKISIIKGEFDLLHLKKIHKYIFGDIYEWAGEIRWVNIAKGNMFCSYEYIEANAVLLFNRLRRENYLKDAAREEIPLRLAYYLSEINVLHPFREGNGRVQRLFIEYLAENAGYRGNTSVAVIGRKVDVIVWKQHKVIEKFRNYRYNKTIREVLTYGSAKR
ncbi:MAG: Fic family protein [Thermincola sp.]|jgi:cell filamentation protein|nr:Fic family protein [Thermincola sp.]MDT3703305.1 Fic family protein [Thermincola sp.]